MIQLTIALVAGLGEACRLAETEYEQNIAAYKEKKDAVLEIIEKSGIKYEINGNQDYCMPNTINLSITGVESEALMLSSKQFCEGRFRKRSCRKSKERKAWSSPKCRVH